MAETYSVQAILSAQDKNFSSTMEKALGATNSLEAGTGKSMLGMSKAFAVGQVAASAIIGTLKMVSSGIGAITGEMNDNAKAWAMFEGNMQMIGKSEAEITKVKTSLQDFATQTIYSASDMAQTYSQMAAIGVENTEQLVKGMGGLAASAENPAQAMKSLSTQMVQALSQPEMKWADFRIMLEQAPAAMAQVAEHMGMSLNELIQGIQDGEVASKDFANAVAEVGTNEHYQAMATEFKTIDQAVDGLVETMANKFMPIFELATEIGIKAVEAFTNWIDAMDITKATNGLRQLAVRLGIVEGEFNDLTDVVSMTTEEIANVADKWEDMTLEEKQATVETMGQEDLAELMELMGVDFDSIPDEYTKNAYLNAYGKDALEELLWVTGTWHDLTLEEKWAVLKQQIENDQIIEVIEQRDLWNEAEFISQLANINMNDDNALQQVTDLINKWGELDGLEPIELEADATKVEQSITKLEKIDWLEVFSGVLTGAQTALGEIEWSEIGTKFGELLAEGINNFAEIDVDLSGLGTQLGELITTAIEGLDVVIESALESLAANVDWTKLMPKVEFSKTWGGERFEIDWGQFFKNLMNGGHGESALVPVKANIEVEPDVKINESNGSINQQIEQEIERGGGGTSGDGGRFQTDVDVEATPNIEVEDSTSWIDEITNIFKTKTVSAQVEVEPLFSSSVGSGVQSTSFANAPTVDYSALIEATNSAMESVNQATQSGMQRNVEAVRQGGSQMVMAMLTSGNSMTTTSQNISNRIIEVFNQLQSRMFGAGFNAGSGFNQGLASQRSNIVSTAQSIADAVSNTINDALRIASPSKLLYQSGSWAIEGMVLGMESMVADVKSAAKEIAVASVPEVSDIDYSYGLSGLDSHIKHSLTDGNETIELGDKLDDLITAVRDGRVLMMDKEKVGEQVSDSVDRYNGRYGDLNELLN